ncbi:MAG: RpiB/LacA/LacB family sugar-phosphate isomerase, partial [Candidatus Chisholmbacteria bacterium]|nr:RpiB/LacA/LacB family sugar-phosphate isomerase [Candidatus Chisholmbacteria bacterium]
GGFELKEKIKQWLGEWGHEVVDHGAFRLDATDDYPDFVVPAAKAVSQDKAALGIVLGRSGNGEAIAANKMKSIRAAVCVNVEMARKAREHNDANVLALGGDYVSEAEAKEIVRTFLETPFSGDERHVRRLEKIMALER